MPPTLILIGGPTAAGKSALAMQLARQRNGVIINADAMQIYAGLPILTAQPSGTDRDEIPHKLYETTDAGEASSVGKWLPQAQAAIDEALAQDRTPIVVGGTGLYFSALTDGLADIPPIPDTVRAQAQALYLAQGEERFRAALALRDPASAARIARNDQQRLIRAYEVIEHTGKTLTDWQKASAKGSILQNASIERHLLSPDRAELYAACDRRLLVMIDQGAIAEVERLLARNLSPTLPAMKTLGVREITAYLQNEMPLATAIAQAQQMTRNYAKRQMTWFRNRWKAEEPL